VLYFNKFVGTLVVLFALTACHSSGGSGSSGAGLVEQMNLDSQQSIWMQKNEAEELRTTGKIQSVCEEVKKNPKYKIMNVRLVDSTGATYAYDPKIGKIEELKIGTLDPSGSFFLTGFFQEQLGNVAVRVSMSNDVMTFSYFFGSSKISTDYLRSYDEEAGFYYSMQEACKKGK